MAFDEALAERVRGVLRGRGDVEEKKMFGGLCFMVSGTMCCGIAGDDLMCRVGPEQYEDALKQPGTRPMDFTGRPLKGLVYVAQTALGTEAALARWVERAIRFATSAGDRPLTTTRKERTVPAKGGAKAGKGGKKKRA